MISDLMRLLIALAAAVLVVVAAPQAGADAICSVNQTPCEAANTKAGGQTYKAALLASTTATFSTGLGVVITCTTATISGSADKTTEVGPLPMTFASLAFSGCTHNQATVPPNSTCTVTVDGLPYSGDIRASGSSGTGIADIDTFLVTISCATLPSPCSYAASTASLTATGGNPAMLASAGIGLTKAAGSNALCPGTATWNATYSIADPKSALYVQSQPDVSKP